MSHVQLRQKMWIAIYFFHLVLPQWTRVIVTTQPGDKKRDRLWKKCDTLRGHQCGERQSANKSKTTFKLLQECMTWCENEQKVKTSNNSTDNILFFNPVYFCSSLLLLGDISSLCKPIQTQKLDETFTYENMEIHISYANIFIEHLHSSKCNLR